MKLRDYLYIHNIRQKDFAKTIDYNPFYLSSVIGGTFVSGAKFRRKVQEATGGLVSLSDWDEVKPKIDLVKK